MPSIYRKIKRSKELDLVINDYLQLHWIKCMFSKIGTKEEDCI
ncbi:hypothetical protein FYJ83_18225 [Tissierella sp. DSM 105185]|uniref:Uncharacterized protein n=1 Tax=Tissierella pigra TaxID=2607614 RepID=A0A6N7XPJ1_9FIRM|nr:hypothetical protein [Tissierella pigra]